MTAHACVVMDDFPEALRVRFTGQDPASLETMAASTGRQKRACLDLDSQTTAPLNANGPPSAQLPEKSQKLLDIALSYLLHHSIDLSCHRSQNVLSVVAKVDDSRADFWNGLTGFESSNPADVIWPMQVEAPHPRRDLFSILRSVDHGSGGDSGKWQGCDMPRASEPAMAAHDFTRPVAPDDDTDTMYQQVMTAQVAAGSPLNHSADLDAVVGTRQDAGQVERPVMNGIGPASADLRHHADARPMRLAPSAADRGREDNDASSPLVLPTGPVSASGDLAPSPLPGSSLLLDPPPDSGASDAIRPTGRVRQGEQANSWKCSGIGSPGGESKLEPDGEQTPCTSDSVHREDVQAEVRRQLSGVLGQLQEERLRAESALAQAQSMRQQLERERLRKTGGELEGIPDGVPVFSMTGQDDGGLDGHVMVQLDLTRQVMCMLERVDVWPGTIRDWKFNLMDYQSNHAHYLDKRLWDRWVKGVWGKFNLVDYRSNHTHYLVLIMIVINTGQTLVWLMSPEHAGGEGAAPTMTTTDRVLLSMARGIEELLKKTQSPTKTGQPEAVKPGAQELPKLPEYDPETAAIDMVHWMTHIGPILEDISDTSGLWWGETLRQSSVWYQEYASASPLQRLQLKPVAEGQLQKPEWSRVERRAVAMLLSAIPDSLRRDIITHGDMTAMGVVCRILTVYQPGNKQEKSLILKNLESPGESTTSSQAAQGLRRWLLWLKRARTLGIVEPDASILMKGLDNLTQRVIRSDSELAFRVSLVRASLQVDNNPQPSTVLQYHQHLLAELETHARTTAREPSSSTTTLPVVKGLVAASSAHGGSDQTPKTPSSSTTTDVCRFFLKDKGCSRGNKCRYKHSMAGLTKEEKKSKCLACGATTHRAKDCMVPGAKRKEREAGGDAGHDLTPTSPTATSAMGSDGSVKPAGGQRPMKAITFEAQEATEMKSLMAKALDEIRRLQVLRLDGAKDDMEVRKALLDSGATHALRGASEWERSTTKNVDVTLAGEGKARMQQSEAGTLLVDSETPGLQTIVPLGKVISTLGYALSWTPEGCWLVCPDGKKEKLHLRNGCPEIEEEKGLKLIEELENQLRDTTEASARHLHDVSVSWWTALQRYVETQEVKYVKEVVNKAVFLKSLDEEEMVRLHDFGNMEPWERLKTLPVNRRRRKRLCRSSTWVVRWNRLERGRDPIWALDGMHDAVVLDLDRLRGQIPEEELWKVLLWAALEGKISAMVLQDVTLNEVQHRDDEPFRAKVHYLNLLATLARFRRKISGGRIETALVLERPASMKIGATWAADGAYRKFAEEVGIEGGSMATSDIANYVIRWCGLQGPTRARLAKLASEAAWRTHVLNHHQPFERNCAVCVRNAATGRQHRSTLHPMAYTLSIDVAGPLKYPGVTPDSKSLRYFLIGAYRFPRLEGVSPEAGFPLPSAEDEEFSEGEEQPGDADPFGAGVEPGKDEMPEEGMPSEEEEKKAWKKMMEGFTTPVALETAYFAVPMRNKKAASVLPALQRIYVDVKALGFPMHRVHGDRAGELRSKMVRNWILKKGMLPTTTEGDNPASNGVAEAGVKYLKKRIRILLDSGAVHKAAWPLALHAAASMQRCDRMGLPSPMLAPFGSPCYIKTKRYKTGAVEDLGPKWTRGKYLGPSMDVRGGHCILKDGGGYVQTVHVRTPVEPPPLKDVVSPLIVEPALRLRSKTRPADARPHARDAPTGAAPRDGRRRRLRAKSSPSTSPVGPSTPSVRVMRAQGRSRETLAEVKALAQHLLNMEDFSKEGRLELLEKLVVAAKVRTRRGEGCFQAFGAYCQGGNRGITVQTRNKEAVVMYLNEYLKKATSHLPEGSVTWATLGVFMGNAIPPHTDVHNKRGSWNYVVEISDRSQRGLWVSGDDDSNPARGEAVRGDMPQVLPDGSQGVGRFYDIRHRATGFNPKKFHGFLPNSANDWLLVGYTPSGFEKLTEGELNKLVELGFPIETEDPIEEEEENDDEDPDDEDDDSDNEEERIPDDPDPDQYNEVSDEEYTDRDDEEPEDNTEPMDAEFVGKWEIHVDEPTGVRKVQMLEGPSAEDLSMAQRKCRNLTLEAVDEKLAMEDLEKLQGYLHEKGVENPRVMKAEPEFTKGMEELLESMRTPVDVVYNVDPAEAKAHLDFWKDPILEEFGVVKKGFDRTTMGELLKRFKMDDMLVVPAKVVYTIKPPKKGSQALYRRKARIVACGNMIDEQLLDCFASGAAGETLRCVLVESGRRKWYIGAIDVTGAFLLTPMPTEEGEKVVVVTPPHVLVLLGVVNKQERWKLTRALYGLRQSPRLWAQYRDSVLKDFVVNMDGRKVVLKQGDIEPNLWSVHYAGENRVIGAILIYVDDILICGDRRLVETLGERFKAEWEVSELELCDEGRVVRFLGCEIQRTETGCYFINQEAYIAELLRAYEVPKTQMGLVPCPREWMAMDEEEENPAESSKSPGAIREAQKITGELLWISQRSRPDLAFHLSIMASHVLKNPEKVIQIGSRILGFLQRTKARGLLLVPGGVTLQAFSDSSFAPTGRRSHTGTLVCLYNCPVAWRSGRQSFVTLSTAECELVASIDSIVLARAVMAVIRQLDIQVNVLELQIDNMAAVGLSSDGAGSWRTRHLKVRASYLREQAKFGFLKVCHCRGQFQKADLLTKPLPKDRHEELCRLWGLQGLLATELKAKILRILLMCGWVCGSKAENPQASLQLDGSIEFYILMMMACITMLVAWEVLRWAYGKTMRWFDRRWDPRRSRRLERLRNMVEDELAEQLNDRLRTPATRPIMVDAQVQCSMGMTRLMSAEPARIEIREVEREVPTWHPGPFYVTNGGDHVHITRDCWGLRNASQIQIRTFCACCRNGGRQLYATRTI
ncbi:RE1 [Symbiodinium natans]|uniref:RE1 protein n=1 Tax=Symbiodinium natans TaxID=878477 RepID=A0A812JXP9_9DINO|nr:RE1 [Symbiodinium natans]